MVVSEVKATFECNVEKVWATVTTLEHYSWRSDLSKVEVLNNKEFIEHTKDGYQTKFRTTVFEPLTRWEFELENDNMKGRWIGIFSEVESKTVVEFTEQVVAKKLLMKPFVPLYLKKQQAKYISDLQKELMR
jgi:5-methylthioribose kinase